MSARCLGGLAVAWLLAAASTIADVPRIGTRLAVERAVAVEGARLEAGPGTIELLRGHLAPAVADLSAVGEAPRGDRAIELVFVGEARFRIDPPDPIEAGQLQLFTGRRAIDVPLTRAVLVVADPREVARLSDGGTPLTDQAVLESLSSTHADWQASTERRLSGVEPSIWAALLGDPLFDDYVAIWVDTEQLGDFVYQVDPEDEEPVTVASFKPVSVRGWDRLRLAREIRLAQRKGRFLGVRLEDIGAWDVWMSAEPDPDRAEGGFAGEGRGFETLHYDVDVTLDDRRLDVEGSASLHLEAQQTGRRILRLELFRDLRVERIVDPAGHSLPFVRSGREIVVGLREPSTAGDRFVLRVDYSGRAFNWVGPRTFDLEDTIHWHPHCGQLDRATYDVTLRWPRRYELAASGRRVAGGIDGGKRWERRRLDRAGVAFSFVLGRFVAEERQIDGIDVRVVFARNSDLRRPDPATAALADSLVDVLRDHRQSYGDYPLDYLTVAVLPRGYSQSFLGFMTLSDSVLDSRAARSGEARAPARDLTIAHETAHQWWGNLVGWSSYRDQWLSEALANYAAVDYLARREDAGEDFLAEMSAGWRESLSARTADGRVVESLGPVVLGARLNSSAAANGYRPIVYRKGAVILAMMARTVGPDAFRRMLRELAHAASDRVLTTGSFVAAIERMSSRDFDGFARRFIYGTGIPQVYYDYAIEQRDADWVVRGEAHVVRRPEYRFRVARREGDESWDVVRRRHDPLRDDAGAFMVPFVVTLDAVDDDGRPVGRKGQFLLGSDGKSFEVEVPVAAEPRAFHLDPRGEIFARFYAEQRYPKRVARYRGLDHLAAGRLDRAEAELRRALAMDSDSLADRGQRWILSNERISRNEDASIHLALARIAIERAAWDDARLRLAAIEALDQGQRELFRMERDVLAARIDIRTGDVAAAHRRLKRTLRLASPKHGAMTWRTLLRQLQLRSERQAMTEAWALLATASLLLGEAEDYLWAADEARERAVDLSELEAAGARELRGAL